MQLLNNKPPMWKQPAKEKWVRDAIAAGRAREQAKLRRETQLNTPSSNSAASSFHLYSDEQAATEKAYDADVNAAERLIASIAADQSYKRTAPIESYSIDWSSDTESDTVEMPSNLKPLNSLVPPVKNGYPEPELYNGRIERPKTVSLPLFRSDPISTLTDAINGEEENFDPLQQPLTANKSSADTSPSFSVQNGAIRKQAEWNWALSGQESNSSPHNQKPKISRPVMPTHTAFIQRQQDYLSTTLELEPYTAGPQSSESVSNETSKPRILKAVPAACSEEPTKTEALTQGRFEQLEQLARTLRNERDEAALSAEQLSQQMEKIRRHSKHPLANIMLMAKLLSAMGLSQQQQSVVERILQSANSITTDLYGVLGSEQNREIETEPNVAALPVIHNLESHLKESA